MAAITICSDVTGDRSKVRSCKEQYCIGTWGVQDQGWWPRGATPCPRSGEVAERSNTISKEWWLHQRKTAERSYSTFKVRRGDLVQGKEQWLHFAIAVMKRYLTSKVR